MTSSDEIDMLKKLKQGGEPRREVLAVLDAHAEHNRREALELFQILQAVIEMLWCQCMLLGILQHGTTVGTAIERLEEQANVVKVDLTDKVVEDDFQIIDIEIMDDCHVQEQCVGEPRGSTP